MLSRKINLERFEEFRKSNLDHVKGGFEIDFLNDFIVKTVKSVTTLDGDPSDFESWACDGSKDICVYLP